MNKLQTTVSLLQSLLLSQFLILKSYEITNGWLEKNCCYYCLIRHIKAHVEVRNSEENQSRDHFLTAFISGSSFQYLASRKRWHVRIGVIKATMLKSLFNRKPGLFIIYWIFLSFPYKNPSELHRLLTGVKTCKHVNKEKTTCML